MDDFIRSCISYKVCSKIPYLLISAHLPLSLLFFRLVAYAVQCFRLSVIPGPLLFLVADLCGHKGRRLTRCTARNVAIAAMEDL